MANGFERTLRSLNTDRFRLSLWGIVVSGLVISAWLVWFFAAEIGAYEITDSARLVAKRAVHPIEASLTGRVVFNDLTLDRKVDAEQVLIVLDAREFEILQEEEQTRRSALSAELEKLREEFTAEQKALEKLNLTTQSALAEARARYQQARAAYRIAEDEAKRFSQLRSKAVISEFSYIQAREKAQEQQALMEVQNLAIRRLKLAQETKVSDRNARIARLNRKISQMEGGIKTSEIKIKKLAYEIERHRIKAPISGHIAEISAIEVGAFVTEGDRLAAIVPDGELKMLAHFLPSAALGRIKPGQHAHLRVQGFPWTQYGTIPATVTRVGREVRDGKIRVELTLDRNFHPLIPVQHGIPGTVEIETERISPATLLLRIVGRLLIPSARARTQT